MRLNRILAVLGLVVATGIALIWVKGQNLRLNQKVSELHRQREVLAEQHARLRLAIGRLAAPARVLENLDEAQVPLREPQRPVSDGPRSNGPVYMQR